LSEFIQKQLERIEQLIVSGEYHRGLETIETNLREKDIFEDDQLQLLNLKANIQNRLGNYKETYEITESILEKKKDNKNTLIYLEALTMKAISTFLLNKIKQSVKLVEDCMQLVNKISNVNQKKLAKRKSHVYGIKGALAGNLGNYKEGVENLQISIKYAKESDSKDQESFYSTQLAMTFYFQEKLDEAEEVLERAFKIAKSIENKHELAFVYNRMGVLKCARFKCNEALEYYLKSESLLKELGSTFLFAGLYVNIATLYQQKYQLDEALRYCYKALEYGFMEYIMYSNIGEIYLWKNEFEKAEEFLCKAMKSSEKATDSRVMPSILYNLTNISLEKQDKIKAQEYLKKLEILATEKKFEHLKYYYNIGLTQYYKSSSDISDWSKAKKLLNMLLKDEELSYYYRIDALFSLLEIRLMELQITPNKETLNQVRHQILELQSKAEEKQLYWVIVELFYLRSQLALLELNIKNAFALLTTARTIAEDKGLEFLIQKVEREQKKINNQIEMWSKFQEQEAPLSETLKEIPLKSTTSDIVKETIMEVRDENTGYIKEYRKLFTLRI